MPFKRDGRWVAKVVVNGRQHWVGSGYATKTEARKAEEAFRDTLVYGAGVRANETCDSFAHRWASDYPRPKPASNRYNEERVRRFADDFRGVLLADVDRPTARTWAIRNPNRLDAVRAMFTDALNDGIVDRNPFAGLRIAKSRGRRDIEVLPEAELRRIASVAPAALGDYGEEMGAMLLFAAFTGVRPGELFLLEWADISGQYLTVSKALDKFGHVGTPKNGHARVVTIPPPAYEQLAVLPKGRTHLFLSKTGLRLNHGNHWYAWNQLRSFAGHPGLDFYSATRHFAATYLLELGLSPADAASQLGHTDGGALIMSTYGHPDQEKARKRILEAFVPKEPEGNVTPIRKTGA